VSILAAAVRRVGTAADRASGPDAERTGSAATLRHVPAAGDDDPQPKPEAENRPLELAAA
jgi:hypothetical protein